MKIYNKRWQTIEEIDHGGQASVFKVKDLTTDTFYALKLFHIKKYQKKKLKRIQTEIEIIKQLKDTTNIVKIYDDNLQQVIDEKTQEVFYVMDYAPHGSLKDNDFYFNDVEAALGVFKQILKGVSSAHKAKVIHRDLKPENILLFPTQKEVMISDFGIGLIKDKSDEENVTEDGEIVGPMHFIAPEQFKDPSNADEQSDIYSLGKILFYLLTGKGKIFREEVGDLAKNYKGENPYLPLIQEDLLEKMVTADKDKRFNNIDEVIDDVDFILDKLSENSRRYLKLNEKGPRLYNLFIGTQRQEYIKGFADDIIFSLRLLQWVLADFNKEKKQAMSDTLLKDLKANYKEEKIVCGIETVELFVNNPKQLKEYSEKHQTYSFPNFYLYEYFYDSKSYAIAHSYIEKALEVETNPEIILSYLLSFSGICKDCTCELSHDFEIRVKKLLRETSDRDAKLNLYKILGEYYIEAKDVKRGLTFLEAYLNSDPFDEDVRFKCAYQYSEIKKDASALYHYVIALSNSKDKSVITNNLGFLYGSNEMPIKAMVMYEESYGLGNTLAGSNLASQYLKIGLKDKAATLLRTIIREHKDYNERVDEILGTVHRNISEEEGKEKELNKLGTLVNGYNVEYVEALASQDMYSWLGYWEINSRYVIEIKEINGKLTIDAAHDTDISIKGKFDGNNLDISELILNESTYSIGDKYNEGFIFLKNANVLKGLIKSEVKVDPLEIKGKKIDDIEKYKENHKTLRDTLGEALAMRARLG